MSFAVALALAGSMHMAAVVEKEVEFEGLDGLTLKGTLTMPPSPSASVPAVLLLPGSGPTDRNGNQPPAIVTNLLYEIADRLAQAGFASLRFDKRAAAVYASKWPTEVKAQNDFFGWDRFVGDALAGFKFLKKQSGIDPKRVVIAGHSEGSVIAAQICHDTVGTEDAPAALILMAIPGRDFGALIRDQVAANLKRAGLNDAQQKTYNDFVDAAIKQIIADGTLPKETPPPGLAGLFPPSALKLLRSYFTTDIGKLAEAYEGPVLIVQGEKDIQVSLEKDTPLIQAALKRRPKGTLETLVVPGASHNLKAVDNPDKDPGIAGPIVPAAHQGIVGWLKKTLP